MNLNNLLCCSMIRNHCRKGKNVGVTFLGKLGLSFHIEIRGFVDSENRRFRQNPRVLKSAVFQNLWFSISGVFQNPQFLPKSTVFKTKIRGFFKSWNHEDEAFHQVKSLKRKTNKQEGNKQQKQT